MNLIMNVLLELGVPQTTCSPDVVLKILLYMVLCSLVKLDIPIILNLSTSCKILMRLLSKVSSLLFLLGFVNVLPLHRHTCGPVCVLEGQLGGARCF